jgi:alpha-tubulin suppressor-like RCC1 family protein
MSRFARLLSVVSVAASTLTLLASPPSPASAAGTQARVRALTATFPDKAVAGTKVEVTGRLTHSTRGSTVRVQRRSGTRWVKVAATHTTNRRGHFDVRVTMPGKPGSYRFRAVAPATTTGRAATSKVSTVKATTKPVSPNIMTTSLRDGTVGTYYSTYIDINADAHGNLLVGTWTITSGALPAGLEIDPTDGSITGTPTDAGTAAFTVRFTRTSDQAKDSAQLAIHIDPVPSNAPGAVQLSAGGTDTCRVAANHTLWCWGSDANNRGGYAVPDPSYSTTPMQVGTDDHWAQVSAGELSNGCAVKTDYTVWCWGDNSEGQVGYGEEADAATPQWVPVETHFAQVSMGAQHACAVGTGGSLWCWGSNASGQLGNPDADPTSLPSQVGTGFDWTSVSAAGDHTCATRTDHTLWCWGANTHGELGVNSVDQQTTPAQVPGTTWAGVDAGVAQTCATRTDGTLWCWGMNVDNRLGFDSPDNPGDDVLTPTEVGTETDWSSVSTGGSNDSFDGHTCATKTDHTLWCWGSNNYGELGDDSPNNAATEPEQIGELTTWASVTAGSYHSCGTLQDGSQYCWGRNDDGAGGDGRLGDGTTTDRYVPTAVSG